MANQTQLSTFNFETKTIRTIAINNEPWFLAKDICEAVNISNYRDAIERLDDDEKGVALTDTLGGQQEMNIISESGMYTLILRCRDAVKKGSVPHRFRKWVTSEVLPTIRKTGSYGYTTQPTDLLTAEQQKSLRELVVSNAKKLPRDKQAGAIVQAWSKLKSHFKVPYRKIPQESFTEAISIVQRHYVEWELVDDTHSTHIAHRKNMLEFDEEEVLDIVSVCTMACYMNDTIRFLEKPMRLLGIPRAGMLYSEGFEYQRSLKEALPVFEKILAHFPPEGDRHSPIYGYTKPWDKVHHFFPMAKERLTY